MKRPSMAQALSHAAGHSFSRPTGDKEGTPEGLRRTDHKPKLLAAIAPSRAGKKPVTSFFEPEVSRQIKKLGLDQDKTMQEIIQESLNDLFRKYDLPPIA